MTAYGFTPLRFSFGKRSWSSLPRRTQIRAESITISTMITSHSSSAMLWIDGTRIMVSTRITTAIGRKNSATAQREST